MRATEVGANAQIREPTGMLDLDWGRVLSKIATAMRKTYFMLKTLYNLPKLGCNAVLMSVVFWKGVYVVRKKAEAYQPTSFKEWKWSDILGIAVATIV
jgi:hypothetical protein